MFRVRYIFFILNSDDHLNEVHGSQSRQSVCMYPKGIFYVSDLLLQCITNKLTITHLKNTTAISFGPHLTLQAV